MRRSGLVLGVLLWTVESAAAVEVRGDPAPIDATKLDQLVALELGGDAEATAVTVTITEGRATIDLRRPGREPHTGGLDLPTGASDAERTIALYVGELSREPDAAPAPPPPPPKAHAAEADLVPTAAPLRAPPPAVIAGASGRVFGRDGASFFGPYLGARAAVGQHLEIGVLARYLFASTDTPLGAISAELGGIGGSLAYRFDLHRRFALAVGIAAEGVVVRGQGSSDRTRASDASALGFTVSTFLDGRSKLAGPLFLTAGVEIGGLAPGLDLASGTETALAASGIFAGGHVGLGVSF